MSGNDHKGNLSKFAALREQSARMRREAVHQRENCEAQRKRARSHDVELTYSTALHDEGRVISNDELERPASAIVAITGSAGGLMPLMGILADLPADFAAAVIVAPHMGESSVLPDLIRRRCRLSAAFVVAGEMICPGRVYVCPPHRHLIANPDRTFGLVGRDVLRFPCPSADWLFHTLAATYAEHASVIVLSGSQQDGSYGVRQVRSAGGTVIVQDPSTCRIPSMPMSALGTNCVSAVLAPDEIASALTRAVGLLDVDAIHRQFESPFQSNN